MRIVKSWNTPYRFGGETIVTYNTGEVHLICSQFQGGYVAENSSREPNILYRLDLLAQFYKTEHAQF